MSAPAWTPRPWVAVPLPAPEDDLPEPLPVAAAGWDESKHRRHPAGTAEGGEFAPKESASVALVAEPGLVSGETQSVLDKLRIGRDEGEILDAARTVDETLAYPVVPDEPTIPVAVAPGMGGNDAAFGRTAGRVPSYIKISGEAQDARSSAVHEMGHYLDSLLGQDEWVANGEAALKVPGLKINVWEAYSSEQDTGTLQPVLAAIKETSMWHKLADAAASEQARPRFAYGGREFAVPSGHVDYLIEPPELIARSFEQYIAAKNPDSKLARSSRHFFSAYEGMVPPAGPGYLKGADLERVNAAWDRVLSERGLLKQKPGVTVPPPDQDAADVELEKRADADRKLRALQTS